ncbi:hypothetical protein ACFY2K_42830 [Kitasatospora sp. NPDC001309]|uniref:hypothetical protein n=1 Tax=Kitasatospora sp. NPDC001309 TaxID=3364013 RepID=UPI0036C31AAD
MNAQELAAALRAMACRDPNRLIWSADAYAYGRRMGCSRSTTSNALRLTGLYPERVRARSGMVRWVVERPHWWTVPRTPGKCPRTVRRRCVTCGQLYVPADRAPLRPPEPDEWAPE